MDVANPGMDESVISTVTNASKSPRKASAKTTGFDQDDMIKSVVDYYTKDADNETITKNEMVKDKYVVDEDLPRTDLFELINQHKLHLKFLQENYMCSGKEYL